MVVQTMSDDERVFEAFRALNWVLDWKDELSPTVVDRFKRGTRFPYVQSFERTDVRGNVWRLLFIVPTKKHKKLGLYGTFCYTTYFLPPKTRNDNNAGRGVLFYDPIGLKKLLDQLSRGEKPVRNSCISDIVPHAINRYVERCLLKEGKRGYDIHQIVKDLVLRWCHFDVLADKAGDKSAAKHADKGICPYDVLIRGGGILRGYIVNSGVIRFFTYISPDEMFDNQLERYNEMLAEHAAWKAKGLVRW